MARIVGFADASCSSASASRRAGGLVAYDEELADRVRLLLVGEEGLSERKMFGARVHGERQHGLRDRARTS